MLSDELREHLCNCLIPFWIKLQDTEHGGYYGWMDSDLHVDREAVKGCILNSRILWFFSNAAMCLGKTGQGGLPEAAGVRESAPVEHVGYLESAPVEHVGYLESAPVERGGYPESSPKGVCRWTEADLRRAADQAYRFLREACFDREKGGVYWAVNYRGEPEDTTKHTYNQAFAVYALSSYFRAYHDREALKLAEELITVIESKCFDVHGYKEALDRDFQPVPNDKLSENGVMAERTMNTLLHVMEAYTEYLLACREAKDRERNALAVTAEQEHSGAEAEGTAAAVGEGGEAEGTAAAVGEGGEAEEAGKRQESNAAERSRKGEWPHEKLVEAKLRWILNLIETRIYNPALHRQEVFFDLDMNSLIDLHSYGHDIETAWLVNRCLDVLGDEELSRRMSPLLRSLEQEVYEKAYTNHSLANECERGVVDTKRVWWVQAEGVVGFFNAWQRTGESRYREASEDIWQFIREHLVDERVGGEWFWYTDVHGNPALEKPIVEPWKCPYHNGRMCMEIMARAAHKTKNICQS